MFGDQGLDSSQSHAEAVGLSFPREKERVTSPHSVSVGGLGFESNRVQEIWPVVHQDPLVEDCMYILLSCLIDNVMRN